MTVRDLYMTVADFFACTPVTAYDKTGTRINEVKCWDDMVEYHGEKEVLNYCFETKTLILGTYYERIN